MTKLSEIKVGDELRVIDDGFTCMRKDDIKKVENSKLGFFINCVSGAHFLNAQTKDFFNGVKGDDTLVGLELVRSKNNANNPTVEET